MIPRHKAAQFCCGMVAIVAALVFSACPARAAGSHDQSVPAAEQSQGAHPPAAPENLEARAPQPASIRLKAGKLTVGAHNSDLAGILRRVARLSGMKIEGLGKSSRVFGDYGPGNPREVIASLLNGSGYNFMMIGTAGDGVPHRLLLTEKTKAPSASSNPKPPAPQPPPERMELPRRTRRAPAASTVNRPRNPSSSKEPNQDQKAAPPPDLGPGAIYPPPPENKADRQQRVKQMMDRLRKMHQQRQRELNEDQ